MFSEKEINNLVQKAVKNIVKTDDTPITTTQLVEIISKSISSCLLSQEFIDYIDQELGSNLKQAKR